MKNTYNIHLFYIVFQISKVLFYKNLQDTATSSFVVVLHQQLWFLQLFRTSFNIMKKIFATNCPCLMDLSLGDLFNGQKFKVIVR